MGRPCTLGRIYMDELKRAYYEKRSKILLKNLHKRNFEAYYCKNKEEALEKALSLIPEGATVGWGGCMSCEQIGLLEAVRAGNYVAYDRDTCQTPDEKDAMMRKCLTADVFLTGANALSLSGEMVNIDGTANRVAAICYGPANVIVVVGMNKVCQDLEVAIDRAKNVAAPLNMGRFGFQTPCNVTGSCGDCVGEECICNQMLITRHCRVPGRIKFILVGEDLGL